MIGRGQSRTITAVSSAALLAAGSISWAQQSDAPSGARFTVDLSAGASFDTNEGLDDPSLGDTTRSNIGATFGFLDETEVSRLAISIFSRAEWSQTPDDNDDGFDFRLPSGSLAYSRDGRDSRLDLTARYFFDRVDDDVLIFLDENLNPVDLIVDGGDLRRITLGANLSTGLSAPIGTDIGVFFDDRDYIDTTDPDLYDRTSYGGNATLRFNLTEVMTGRLTASYSRLEEDDIGDPLTENFAYGVGLDYQFDQITIFRGDVAFTTIEETIFDVTTTQNDGWAYNLGVDREMPNGTIGVSLAHIINEASTRTQISFNRSRDLPDGRLAYSVGYSVADDDDGGEDRFVGGLDYRRDLRTGNLTASFTQEAVANDDDEDTLVSRIALNYNQDINSVSSFGLNFGLGRSQDIGGGDDSTTRANLGVTYRRELTRDWDWVVGYEARYLLEDGGDPATGNRVFTLIDRSFTLRP
jgi:hypothetical protein